ncbi:DUF1592 domain-containing protein [Haloferula chungangensis]|uniref:DUF1592 domain-containing protein n=1 Tax=Haloferula chungangensis TaxID=1048331 RepID=A0ABW2LB71_9BACT
MNFASKTSLGIYTILLLASSLQAEDERTLEELKVSAAKLSKYLSEEAHPVSGNAPEADLEGYRREIAPILEASCVECHGPDKQKAKFRIDTLDPDMVQGEDAEWWLEVIEVLTNGDMPPEDEDVELADEDPGKVIDWLSGQVHFASQAQRAESGHSSFRRMTSYEYNYALQDLLGLEVDFANGLPPESLSEDGFKNSSEVLQITASQYGTYLDLNREALERATVSSERPEELHWAISADAESKRKVRVLEARDPGTKKRAAQNGTKGAHYKNLESGETVSALWSFRKALDAWEPTSSLPEPPESGEHVVVIPGGQRHVVELGNRLPDAGTLRVRVRASRASADSGQTPKLALEFGWQGDLDQKDDFRISREDLVIDAPAGEMSFYQWEIPLEELRSRNPLRSYVEMGAVDLTSPSEYLRLHNSSRSEVHVDYVEITAPVFEEWPPASHQRIFIDSENRDDEIAYAREILSHFMRRAWRRQVSEEEVDFQMTYFHRIRPECDRFEQAVVETLATVLSSPRFLYLVQSDPSADDRSLDDFELATRLSMFLWCSVPDDELLDLAAEGRLGETEELLRQVKRMLADPRHERFTEQFVKQWLHMERLAYIRIDRRTYPDFDRGMMGAMQEEPVAFFEELLRNDRSVMDFLHADYAVVNQQLARHYGIDGVEGNHFRKVPLKPEHKRGGLLTQAGLLTLNSDGKDSNPLKRGVWILESILNDPPPPPPAAVPEIDLTDPEVLKMTIKERMEDHRDDPACSSCHQKIDPWGIAFENFDATGAWRSESQGKKIDASSLLNNQQEIDGVDGVKRYLLGTRQDQFARAIVHKLGTFALGRPLSFADRASVEGITADLRKEGDGLATLINLMVTSELFRSK